MNSEFWRKVSEVLGEVVEVTDDQRDAIINDRCGGDESWVAAVRSMVKAYEDAGDIFERSTQTDPGVAPVPPDDGRIAAGTRIGPYVVHEFIDEGGFGQVYRAEQLRPLRRERVALKVIKPGMDTRHVLARFEAERQALALMNHPNIAKVFDAGTTPNGLSYFVMEFIAGERLTAYCDQRHLEIEDRLRLFVQICEAVQHAHQKGIIHRDIKPGNILVTDEDGRPTPKVIDFGVAKALQQQLTEETLYTGRGTMVGTVPYMSPEQVDPTETDIDTRTDIYSLGVLLYELLVGTRPFSQETLHGDEAGPRGVIRNVVPPRPSRRLGTITSSHADTADAVGRTRNTNARALRRRLRGDLDRITMKCLEKERSRRYATATGLALDVGRHLRHEPIQAVRPELGYRLKKFFVRRRGPVIAATAVVVALAVMVGQGIARSRIQKENARIQVELGREEAKTLLEQAWFDAFIRPEDAMAQMKLAAEKDPDSVEPPLAIARLLALSERDAAVAQAKTVVERFDSGEAAALLAGLLAEQDPEQSRRYRRQAEQRLLENADSASARSRAGLQFALAFGETDRDRAIEMFDASLELFPWSFEALWQRALRRYQRGITREGAGKIDAALEDLAGTVEDARLMVRVRDDLALTWIQQGAALMERARIVRAKGPNDRDRAAWSDSIGADLDAALVALDLAVERQPDNWSGYFNRALVHGRKGDLLQDARDRDGAHAEREKGLADLERAIARKPDEGRIWAEKPGFHYDLGQYEETVSAATRAIEVGEDLSVVRRNSGYARMKLDDWDGAVADFTVGVQRDPTPEELFKLLDVRGFCLVVLERHEKALADAERAIRISPRNVRVNSTMGRALLGTGDAERALAYFDRAVSLSKQNWNNRLERGIANWKLERHEEALQDLSAFAEIGETDSYWIHLWIWEIERLRGNEEAAGEALEAASKSTEVLLARLLAAFRGEIDGEQVVQSATSDSKQLYVLYNLGVNAFLEERHEEAAKWFTRATEIGTPDWMEHELAVWHLRELL